MGIAMSPTTGAAAGCWGGGYGQANARANHDSQVPAAFGDGSVHFINTDINTQQWFFLLSSNDQRQPTWGFE
jgi:hypothetical protein